MPSFEDPYPRPEQFSGINNSFRPMPVDQTPYDQLTLPDNIGIDMSPSINLPFQLYSDALDKKSKELKDQAKKISDGLKYGNPSHSKVQSLQRVRRHTPAKPIGGTGYYPTTMSLTETDQIPETSEALPSAIAAGALPGPESVGEGAAEWWFPPPTFTAGSDFPPEDTFEEGILDM
ncbi:MAG: hypothetical protein Q9219_007385 [cf. Caloplaca sp. 3 TL-2023]